MLRQNQDNNTQIIELHTSQRFRRISATNTIAADRDSNNNSSSKVELVERKTYSIINQLYSTTLRDTEVQSYISSILLVNLLHPNLTLDFINHSKLNKLYYLSEENTTFESNDDNNNRSKSFLFEFALSAEQNKLEKTLDLFLQDSKSNRIGVSISPDTIKLLLSSSSTLSSLSIPPLNNSFYFPTTPPLFTRFITFLSPYFIRVQTTHDHSLSNNQEVILTFRDTTYFREENTIEESDDCAIFRRSQLNQLKLQVIKEKANDSFLAIIRSDQSESLETEFNNRQSIPLEVNLEVIPIQKILLSLKEDQRLLQVIDLNNQIMLLPLQPWLLPTFSISCLSFGFGSKGTTRSIIFEAKVYNNNNNKKYLNSNIISSIRLSRDMPICHFRDLVAALKLDESSYSILPRDENSSSSLIQVGDSRALEFSLAAPSTLKYTLTKENIPKYSIQLTWSNKTQELSWNYCYTHRSAT